MKKKVVLLLAVLCFAALLYRSPVAGRRTSKHPPSPPLEFGENTLALPLPDEEIHHDPSSTDYQGLSREQWQRLRDQKERYGQLSDEELREACFNGRIDCPQFMHLEWEHPIAVELIHSVGADEFQAWTRLMEKDTSQCASLYRFAEYFSIGPDELLVLITNHNLTNLYDLNTVKRRYEYFLGDMQEDTAIEADPSAAADYQGLTQLQWNRLQQEKQQYGHLPKEERERLIFGGTIDCTEFVHLRWEHFVAIPLILHVGGDEYEAWQTELDVENNPDARTIYGFAEHFSLPYEELAFVIEAKDLGNRYDLDTLKSRYEYFLGDLGADAEFDPSTIEFADSTVPVHQGFTQEQWDILQYQKKKYGHLPREERGRLCFNGEIECADFDHFAWEQTIALSLIHRVGSNEFESWLAEINSADNSNEMDLYRFAIYFSISLDELVSLIETDDLTHVYDVDTVKRRYEYFAGDQSRG